MVGAIITNGMTASAFWRILEQLPGLCASKLYWRNALGSDFEPLSRAFLETTGAVEAVPCPSGCGCAHEVVSGSNGNFVGVCRCEPWRCDDIELAPEDVARLSLDSRRLGRALSRALESQSMLTDLGLPNTIQAGLWSAEAVPIILTIPHSASDLRAVATHLAAVLRQRFVLFAPTARHVDAISRQLLASVSAGFFPLETTVGIARNGSLQALDLPGRILAAFTAEPADDDSAAEVARRAFGVVQALDSGKKKPSLVTIFRLYCMEGIDAVEIARQLGTSRATVVRRLQLIREKTGADPRQLRRFSPHLEKVRDSLADPRASRIRPRSAITEDEEDFE